MAYPPTVPPANRTNTTPQANNHPTDHNQISSALTDIVNELGNNPSGPQGTVQTRLATVESEKLSKSGGTMTGNINMNGFDVYGLPAPNGDSEAVNKEYCDDKVRVAGETMTGNLAIGTNPVAGANDTNGILLNTQGEARFASADLGSPTLWVKRRSSSGAMGAGEFLIRFIRSDANDSIGSVTIASSSSVAFNTTSDHRLKQNDGPVVDPAARVQQLAATAFQGTWIPDEGAGQDWDMLYAHAIEAVAPYAVTGAKDAVDGEGDPIYQAVDYGSMVPLLVAALGDALNRIDALEAAATP